jgi:hypothetical protein
MNSVPPPPLLCRTCGQDAPPGTLPGARCPDDDALFVDAHDAGQRPDDPWLGHRIGGKYALFGIIGVGGFGAVYRAIQSPVGRTVAVKVIRPQVDPASQNILRARFFREAKVVARLADPAIVTLYDYGEEPDGRLYMVFEYIDGVPLSVVLRSGPLGPERVGPLMHQILGALALAHRLGCVHRDLKPGNVMLTRGPFGDDLAKVLDFGIAKVTVSEEVEHSLQSSLETREGVVVGTPKYMAPEQARGLEVDGRADLYALGCLAYAMLTGRPPFDDPSAVDVLMAQVSRPAPPFPEHLQVPGPLAAVIFRALSKSPLDRFASAEEMAGAIAAFTPGLAPTREQPQAARAPMTALAAPGGLAAQSMTAVSEGGTSREFAASMSTEPPSVGAAAAGTDPVGPPSASPPELSVPGAGSRRGPVGFLLAAGVGLVAFGGIATLTRPGDATPPAETRMPPDIPDGPTSPGTLLAIVPDATPWGRALTAAARGDEAGASTALVEALDAAEAESPSAGRALRERARREPALARLLTLPSVARRFDDAPVTPDTSGTAGSAPPAVSSGPRSDAPTRGVPADRAHPKPARGESPSLPSRSASPAAAPASRLAVPEF